MVKPFPCHGAFQILFVFQCASGVLGADAPRLDQHAAAAGPAAGPAASPAAGPAAGPLPWKLSDDFVKGPL